ncbi:methionine aminotransferase [Solitalea koreensis]|uniref:Methionine aminotransferase n=2 Tax=Solitalea koreensis TaxID=543615 RepID=A0A521BCZ2_9SPHI|nr:methionine aminotransferase [Solitalea koreensis]
MPNVGNSIFPVMTGLANQYNAVNLAQGFPDFGTDPQLIHLVDEYMKKGFNQYSPPAGVLALREQISELTFNRTGRRYNPETEVVVAAGGTQALGTAITTFIREGDEVIIFEPAYDCYSPIIKLNGGIPRAVELTPPDYRIVWDEVKKCISNKTRMIMINTPHNPTGTTISKSDIEELIKITRGTDIIILSDEVYEHILFDGVEHQSMAKYPELAERSLIVSSFGKTFHTTGWRLGYTLGPTELMKEFMKVQLFSVYTNNTPMQYAVAVYMENYPDKIMELSAFYQQKRDYFRKLMTETRFKLLPVSGSYFQTASFADISDEGDYDFAVRITKEFGVATIPTSAFYSHGTDHKVIRFCFAKKDETLQKAVERLVAI